MTMTNPQQTKDERIKELDTNNGLLKISLEQSKQLLTSCETALTEREDAILKLEAQVAALTSERDSQHDLIEEMKQLCLTNGEVNKIKADAIREAVIGCMWKPMKEDVLISAYKLNDYADQLEGKE